MIRLPSVIIVIFGLLLNLAGLPPGLRGYPVRNAPSDPGIERIFALVNGTVIDGTGAPPVKDGIVLIRGERIEAVGPKAKIRIPPQAALLDVRGGTILPGLIDAHVHNAFDPAVRRKFLEAGITAVCDLGSPLSRMKEFGQSRDDQGPIARGLKAGPIFTAPGGLPDAVLRENLNYEVASPLQARAGVRDVVRRGADVIKVYLHPSAGGRTYPMLDPETLGAIVREAHSLRKLVRAHVTELDVLPLAFEAGVDVIDHIPRPDLSNERLAREIGESKEPLKKLYGLVKVPEYDVFLPRLVEQKCTLVTTLALILGGFLDPEKSPKPQLTIAQAMLDILRQFRDLGGTIALGTDYNSNGERDPAELYFAEVDILLKAGLTPLETIAAATGNAAAASGHGDDLGTLAPGKLADILVVEGNPLVDVRALRKIEAVILGGTVVDR